jgi:hypothetical protein
VPQRFVIVAELLLQQVSERKSRCLNECHDGAGFIICKSLSKESKQKKLEIVTVKLNSEGLLLGFGLK